MPFTTSTHRVEVDAELSEESKQKTEKDAINKTSAATVEENDWEARPRYRYRDRFQYTHTHHYCKSQSRATQWIKDVIESSMQPNSQDWQKEIQTKLECFQPYNSENILAS